MSRVSSETSSDSSGRLKLRSQNRVPLSITVILVKSPPWLCPITTIRRSPGSVPCGSRSFTARVSDSRRSIDDQMIGLPESYEKNQNSYRDRTRASAARRLYISDQRPNDEAVP